MTTDSSYDINFQVNLETDLALPLVRMQQAIEWLLREHDETAGTGVSVVFVDDDEIRKLNQQFRQVNTPTDVLSFPADVPLIPEDEDSEPYLGDLVLGLPYIQRQAQSENHSLSDELVLAVIHGTLHLLDYDHNNAANQAEMWSVQAEALQAMGAAITVPLFTFDDDPSGPDRGK
ncbi:MAG: rRNA maturation RNase YbeY [Chloroflexi bacterium]|nr:rRNA maturation RNase YbeY [Chloroflexota bacterium]